MILVDGQGHMVTTGELGELHAFASSLGLRREWFQDQGKYPHYDLTTSRKWNLAINKGAKLVSTRFIIRALRGRA